MTASTLNDGPLIAQKALLMETVYDRIYHERMLDIPMINIRLGIHAIGFQRWQNNFMGILITPWFMNLVLLPGNEQDWSDMIELSKHSHSFPSGLYEFIVSYDADLGYYQTCSLFSPMFEFSDDQVAIETAKQVLEELMKAKNQQETDIESAKIERIWTGIDLPDSGDTKNSTNNQPSTRERLERPLTRREFFRSLSHKDRLNES